MSKETPDFDEVFHEVFSGNVPLTLKEFDKELSPVIDEFFSGSKEEGIDRKTACIMFLMLCSKGFLKLPEEDEEEWWDGDCDDLCNAAYTAITDLLGRLTDEQ